MPLHVFFPCFGTKTVPFLERESCVRHGVTLVYTSSMRQANTHVCLIIHHTILICPFPHLILFNTPKKSLLKSSYPSQIFVPKKIPESKISNPKKSFNHPRHLKSRVPPPPGHLLNSDYIKVPFFAVCSLKRSLLS